MMKRIILEVPRLAYVETLEELDDWVSIVKALVPSEFAESARLEITAEDSYGSYSVEVLLSFNRPETEQEQTDRLAYEEHRKKITIATLQKQLAQLTAQ